MLKLYSTTILDRKALFSVFLLKFPLWKNHISRRQWLNLVSDWCESVGLVWNFWSHTLRKTWRYQARKNDISEEIVDFVVPLGATIHLAGDTITLVLSTMAVLLMSGVTPTMAMMVPFIFMLGVTMVAAPGIPGGGVYATLGLLEKMFMFTSGQQGLMIAIHFAQDSFGTATNVTGDGAIAICVDKIFRKTEVLEEVKENIV